MVSRVSNPSNRGNPSDKLSKVHYAMVSRVSNPSNRGNPSDLLDGELKGNLYVSQTPLTGAILPTKRVAAWGGMNPCLKPL